MRRLALVSFVVWCVFGVLASASWAVVSPTPVRTNPDVEEYSPAATSGVGDVQPYVAWQQNLVGSPSHYNVYAQPRAGGSAWQVNVAGTSGYGPGPIAGTQSIIYQQVTGSASDLFSYNLSTRVRTKVSSKVDTTAWEYHGVASTKYIAFMRLTSTARILLLYNRLTGSVSQIATSARSCGFCLSPDWVGTTHLVFEQCSSTNHSCQVRVRTIGGSTVTVPRGAAPYTNYGASMSEPTGDVYYISSTTWCGLFVSISRWNIAGGPATSVYDLPEGIDGNSTSLAPDIATPTDTDLLFSQYDCIADNSDIYQIESVNLL